jgi:hypothetical protein
MNRIAEFTPAAWATRNCYALGKLLEGQDEIPFKDFYEPFRDLLQEFGPPRKVYHPEFPFWFLRSEEFWEIEPATARVGLRPPLNCSCFSHFILSVTKHGNLVPLDYLYNVFYIR